MLQTVEVVHLTALPRAYSRQGGSSQRLTRQQLERLGEEEIDPPLPGWPDCYVLMSIAANGSTQITHGPGSVQVIEAQRRPRRRVVRPRR